MVEFTNKTLDMWSKKYSHILLQKTFTGNNEIINIHLLPFESLEELHKCLVVRNNSDLIFMDFNMFQKEFLLKDPNITYLIDEDVVSC